jgi:hypothetical protein
MAAWERSSGQAEGKIGRPNNTLAYARSRHESEGGIDRFGCIQYLMMTES